MVSVIVPFYHGNKYIDHIVESIKKNAQILKETTGDSLELVVVNDSPDDIPHISNQCTQMEIRIIYNEENLGIHKSRVRGLQQCSGERIVFLDQDDIISDDCIASQYKALKEYDFVVSNGWYMKPDKSCIPIYENLTEQKKCLNLNVHYRYRNPIISPGQVMICKDSVPEEWMQHTFKNNGADDGFLWLLMLENNKKGTVNPEKIYTHVYTEQNTSLDTKKMMASTMDLVERMSGKTGRFNLLMLKRRAQYYGNYKTGLLYKLRYFDVGILRYIYSRI